VSSPKALWRGSVGPVGSYTDADHYYVGAEAPLYLSFVNVSSSDYVGDYKGVLRITPRVDFAQTPKRSGAEGFLLVEVLGKRSLFLRALDWL
jgi:hypothetical protein